MKKIISILLLIVSLSFLQAIKGEEAYIMEVINPSFVSYVSKDIPIEEIQITKVVAYSDKTNKDSYASYAVDQNASTKWQTIPLDKNEEPSITYSFDKEYSLSSIKITSPTFPKTLSLSYKRINDDTEKELDLKIGKDGTIHLNGLVTSSITLTAKGLSKISASSYGFEIGETEFFTHKSLTVKEVIPNYAQTITNPFNTNSYKHKKGEDITIKLDSNSPIFKIAIKSSNKNPVKELNLYYTSKGEEILLANINNLPTTQDTLYFEFDPVYTDTLIIKDLNECEINTILLSQWDTNPSSWAATDGLSRSIATYDDLGYENRQNKEVGIFYFFAHATDTKGEKYYDVTKILQNNPNAIETGRGFGPNMTLHWWGEPAFGFYSQMDEWILRKDAKMLSDAGVDFLIFDLSNFNKVRPASYYKDEILLLCDVFTRVKEEGGRPPKFMFFMPPLAPNAIDAFDFWWDTIYKDSLYEDLWYKWDSGKPVALTFKDQIANTPYVDFFEIRNVQRAITPFYDSYKDDWQWVSAYPQGYGYSDEYPIEAMNASPGQNVTLNTSDEDYQKYKEVGFHIGFSIGYDANSKTSITRGRDFSGGLLAKEENLERAIYEGWNFKEQLERVLEKDPRITFLTGWNEWTMYKIPGASGVNGITDPSTFFFWDAFNYRYNRDIQPLAYYYKDATYYQMVDFIRKYKGASPIKEAEAKTISMKDFNDWLSVDNTYYSDISDTQEYTNEAARNDIIMSKVSYDSDNIYFYVKTKENISPYTDPSWMRLFIRTEGKGWEFYDYILNKSSPSQSKATLEKFYNDSWDTMPIGQVDYEILGREMQIKIPKTMLSQEDDISFEFKWHDNMQNQGEALDFTTCGDAAPSGRFNYIFKGKDTTKAKKTFSLRTLFITIIIIALSTIALTLILDKRKKLK